MKTKVCNKCGLELPITKEFFNTRKGSTDGFRNDCKKCHSEKSRVYNLKNPRKNEPKKYNIESLEGEIWKGVEGYEELYQVSNLGRIKSLPKKVKARVYYDKQPRIIKPCMTDRGEKKVSLHKDCVGKTYALHRLIAKVFIPNPLNLPEINHKDENPSNNRVDNLEWCTPKYNSNYGTHIERIAKSKIKPVYQYTLDGEFVVKLDKPKQIEDGGFIRQCVNNCCLGKTKTHKGYKRSYIPPSKNEEEGKNAC